MNMKNQELMDEVPLYQAPTVTTYTAGELLDLIGPVQAYNGDILENDNIMGYYATEDKNVGISA